MITDEQFSAAWENVEYRKIMQSAMRRYRGVIPADEMNSCKMIGLWESLKRYDKSKGRKFTTYLYCGILMQCRKRINRFKYITLDVVASYMDLNKMNLDAEMTREKVRDSVDKLDDELRDLIYSRFFDGKTLREIAKENGYSIETARRRIKKAICKLKKIITK
jgi:RNA polymerase sigma factor (sigma-70 family)